MAYCWQTMSDFAGEKLKTDDQFDWQWQDEVRKHVHFMRCVGVRPSSLRELEVYEVALVERDIVPIRLMD